MTLTYTLQSESVMLMNDNRRVDSFNSQERNLRGIHVGEGRLHQRDENLWHVDFAAFGLRQRE